MDNNNDSKAFSFTYSAKEQAEIRSIREKYTNTDEVENKMERLRKLDAGVTQKAQVVSLIVGVLGALVLGFGMSLIMSDLATILGLSSKVVWPLGISIGLIGCVCISVAYPLYNVILKNERKRITPEIIMLTDELLK